MSKKRKSDEIEEKSSSYSLNITGLRSNEYITGRPGAGQTKGMTLEVKAPQQLILHSIKKDLNNMSENFVTKFIDDQLRFGHFKNMTRDQKLAYLVDIEQDKVIWLDKVDQDVDVRFISVGDEWTDKLNLLTEEEAESLLSGEWLSLKQHVLPLFEQMNGKETMVFRPDNFVLVNFHDPYSEPCNYYFDLVTHEMSVNRFANKRIFPIKINDDLTVGFADDEHAASYEQYSPYKNQHVCKVLEWFTPGLYRSLMQKCVRVRAKSVVLNAQRFPTIDVLTTTFLNLMDHPGSFNPEIGNYVRGGESACKRLAITLVEDATVPPENSKNYITSLFGAAMCFKRYFGRSGFRPSKNLIDQWMDLCNFGLEFSSWYPYTRESFALPNAVKNDLSVQMLEILRSFEGDIWMYKSIVTNNFAENDKNMARPEHMNMQHCLDQHTLTQIAYYYYDPNNIELSPVQIFKIIWDKGTSLNSRKQPFRPLDYVIEAQNRLWFAKTNQIKLDREAWIYDTFKRNIDPAWIAGIIGPIDSKVKKSNVLTFVDPTNISELKSIRKPASSKRSVDAKTQDDPLELQDALDAQKMVRDEMQGNKWRPIREVMLDLDGQVQFYEGGFRLKVKNSVTTWEEYTQSSYSIPTIDDIRSNHKEFELNVDQIYTIPYEEKSDGVENFALQKIKSIVNSYGADVLSRITMHIRPIQKTIAMYELTRDGEGRELSVFWTDGEVFRFLLMLCCIVPSVISTDSSLKFTISNYAFWDKIREIILNKQKRDIQFKQWVDERNQPIHFIDKVPSYDYQERGTQTILDRMQTNNKRGSLIWLRAGSGKTKIIVSVITRLINMGAMPPYCIFTYEGVSFQTIINQFHADEQRVHREGHIPTVHVTNPKTFDPKPFHIYFIEHDKLRHENIRPKLLEIAAHSLVVVDELHKLMNSSQRTSVGYELANLSYDFIGLTATLFKDNDINKVVRWASIVNDFPVTKKNFMVGFGTFISQKVDNGIERRVSKFRVTIDDPRYALVVTPAFGGTASKTNFNEALKICYSAVYHAMLERATIKVEEYRSKPANQQKPVFVVAKDQDMQNKFKQDLAPFNYNILLLRRGLEVDLSPGNKKEHFDIVITTMTISSGYNLTQSNFMIMGVFHSNQATREQLVGRIDRSGQLEKEVYIEIYHAGILSYTNVHYETAAALEASLAVLQ
jgi:hypothetical protein